MKRIIAIICSALILLTLFGCKKKEGDLGKQTSIDKSNGYTIVQEVLTFKYFYDEDELQKNPKAKLDGFKVTKEKSDGKIQTKSDALNIAKKEVTSQYNKINIYYDRTRGIWKIVFSVDTENSDSDGKTSIKNEIKETVYVDEDGYTLATVKE